MSQTVSGLGTRLVLTKLYRKAKTGIILYGSEGSVPRCVHSVLHSTSLSLSLHSLTVILYHIQVVDLYYRSIEAERILDICHCHHGVVWLMHSCCVHYCMVSTFCCQSLL